MVEKAIKKGSPKSIAISNQRVAFDNSEKAFMLSITAIMVMTQRIEPVIFEVLEYETSKVFFKKVGIFSQKNEYIFLLAV